MALHFGQDHITAAQHGVLQTFVYHILTMPDSERYRAVLPAQIRFAQRLSIQWAARRDHKFHQ